MRWTPTPRYTAPLAHHITELQVHAERCCHPVLWVCACVRVRGRVCADASRQYEASQAVEGMRTQLGALAERVASLETFANGTSLKQICRVAKVR